MSKDDPLWVSGCKHCEAFTHLDISIKLYWPENRNQIKDSEFIIIECSKRNIPLVIFRDHVPTVLGESWGRILYRAKKIFGNDIRLNISSEYTNEHFTCYVIKDKY